MASTRHPELSRCLPCVRLIAHLHEVLERLHVGQGHGHVVVEDDLLALLPAVELGHEVVVVVVVDRPDEVENLFRVTSPAAENLPKMEITYFTGPLG